MLFCYNLLRRLWIAHGIQGIVASFSFGLNSTLRSEPFLPTPPQHPSIAIVPLLLFLVMAAGGLTATIVMARRMQQQKLDLVSELASSMNVLIQLPNNARNQKGRNMKQKTTCSGLQEQKGSDPGYRRRVPPPPPHQHWMRRRTLSQTQRSLPH
jgi:branched-subunit amino acid ABC-type transport system permease component